MKRRRSKKICGIGVLQCAWGLRILGWIAVAAAGLLRLQAQLPPSADSVSALRQRILTHISQERFAAAWWGIQIRSLENGTILFQTNAHKLFKPASNAKLFTAALALDRFGPEYRIATSLYAAAPPTRRGTLRGDLLVYGRGDPSFAARFNDGDYSKSLDPLVEALVRAGVKRIRGDLIGDESFFGGPPFGSGWTWDDLQYYYGAAVSALTVDDNVVDLTFRPADHIGQACRLEARPPALLLAFSNCTETVAAGMPRKIQLYRPVGEDTVYVWGQLPLGDPGYSDAVTVPDPARWFVTLFEQTLRRRGIAVSGKLRTIDWKDREMTPLDFSRLTEIASVPSRPLSEILAQLLKPSQNLYAQLLLLHVGAMLETNAPPQTTTEELGLRELKRFTTEAGIEEREMLLEEGSGLSRGALVTPAAVVQLLQFMNRHGFARTFREALPVAGVDGTLRHRFENTPAAGNVRAKTGTIRYVNTLSGYATSAAKEPLVFSIMLNNYQPPAAAPTARDDIDALVLMLVGLNARTD